MLNRFGLTIFFTLHFFFSAAWGLETVGYFCNHCVDFQSARSQAILNAANITCDHAGGANPVLNPDADVQCSAPQRIVILGNHLSDQVYSFLVTRDDQSPWAPQAEPFDLTSSENLSYRTVLDLRRQWETMMAAGIELQSEPMRALLQGGKNNNCPQGTALDAFLDNGAQQAIRDQIAATVTAQLQEFQNDAPWFRRVGQFFSFGISRGGVSASLALTESDAVQRHFSFAFMNSEGGNLFDLPDRLVYEVELATMSGGQAVAEINLRESLSRVAGVELQRLLAAQIDVTNECVLEKLGRLDDGDPGREFRIGGGGLIDPGNTFGTGGSSAGAPGSSGMCTFDFFSNGRFQFTFRAPCNSVSDTEQIKP
ncbi:MAG: hypothetical protein ABR550_04485 [Wenzhouxiangellaceae bacterium]